MDYYALLGEHLTHSYSPLIHNTLFKAKNIDATYILKEIKEENLKDAILDLRKGKFKGYNVTIPYKEKIIPYLDEITPHAKSIGAVNAIYMKDGIVIGDNTDYYGFILELKDYHINVSNRKCYILGTGGASKAIFKALTDLKAQPILVSRTKKEGVISYDSLKDMDLDIIVNTTPVGMYPNIDSSPLPLEVARKANLIVDIIFNPKITKLMSYNQNSYNGYLMLLNQAIKAQDDFLGEIPFDKSMLEKISREVYNE